jgi:hypothetical protein
MRTPNPLWPNTAETIALTMTRQDWTTDHVPGPYG